MSVNKDGTNALPPAVQAQVDEADRIIAEMQAAENPPADPPADPPAPDPKATPNDPAPDPKATPVPDPAPDPDPENKRTDWKQKFHVLQGKYNAEVPRLHSDLKEARATLGGVQDQMNTLTATVAAMKEVAKPAPTPPKPLVSEEEIEQFGPDLIDVMQRVAQQTLGVELDSKLKPVKDSVKQVEGKVAQTETSVAQSARETLYDRLTEAVPGWDAMNKSEPFLEWLAGTDDLTGAVRGNMLRTAFDRNDTERVIAFFKSFQKEHVVETTDPVPATPAEDPPSGDPAPEPQQTLDDLVAPGTPKTGSTGAQEESGKGRIWNQVLITEFHNRKGEFIKKNPGKALTAELAATERDLFTAQSEGRIR